MSELRLPLPAYPYRFELLLEFVKRIAHPARLVVADNTLWRFSAGQLVSYRQEGDAIAVRGPSLSTPDQTRVIDASRHCLGLCRDLSGFYDLAQSDEQLWRVVEPLVGLPIFCSETVFEALITLIIEQHISWKTALRAQRWLLQHFGARAQVDKRAGLRLSRAGAFGAGRPASAGAFENHIQAHGLDQGNSRGCLPRRY